MVHYSIFCQIQIPGRIGGSREDENHKNYQQTEIIATTHEISHNTGLCRQFEFHT